MAPRVKFKGNVVAIETGPSVTAGKWFVFDINNGGYYDDGEREQIEYWAEATFGEAAEPPADPNDPGGPPPPPPDPVPEPEPEPEPEEPREATRRKSSK